jgi:hypothetical protein
LTLEHIATFAESKDGKLYRDICERFGVDPGAALDDDVMAYQLRVALAISHRAEPTDATQPDPFEETRRAAEKVRAMT